MLGQLYGSSSIDVWRESEWVDVLQVARIAQVQTIYPLEKNPEILWEKYFSACFTFDIYWNKVEQMSQFVKSNKISAKHIKLNKPQIHREAYKYT